ncbi:unnamed protein product [Phyllotreta striolata]|uniref:Disks large-associated protein 1 n=1 Tax=Phyllotreta striolata TaxID=444603 RepID=A0A9N9TE02_PHYSR|nr:unnamed protein product [Phyllotreta striolata]
MIAKRTATSKCGVDDVVATPVDVMERSVDSIGTCSLDADASLDISDNSEPSSAGTLRSVSILSHSPEHHLPSYLSLACTVNGYSTTTHYDPIRLASRSRDISPHRLDADHHHLANFTIQNNLISPPNLVPMPNLKVDNTIAQNRSDFYSSMETTKYISEQSFTTNLFMSKDTTDCSENGRRVVKTTIINGQSQTKRRSETTGSEQTKSFIQQRVERLYGPGALAQGFFVTKPNQRWEAIVAKEEQHSRSFGDVEAELAMKQSSSSPTLPVLRHLRPEFRAQLPAISPRKGQFDCAIQKSCTVPEIKVNESIEEKVVSPKFTEKEIIGEKGGEYFLRIVEDQSKRLLEMAGDIESDISTPDLPEEIVGKLRSASGKARLLVSQKMQQFKGLCTNNITQSANESYPITNEDLQGFWDMVMLQVDQVDDLFKEIAALRSNGWREPVKIAAKASNGSAKAKKPAGKVKSSAGNEEARKQREEARRRLIEEKRKSMKSAQQNEPTIEIFVPENAS